jgi:hypothetical protein
MYILICHVRTCAQVSSFAGIDTGKLTASSVLCQSPAGATGARKSKDLCAAGADESESESEREPDPDEREPIAGVATGAMRQEISELRAEVARLGALVQALSERLLA